jgi:uncharacterized protein (DUF4415 family)
MRKKDRKERDYDLPELTAKMFKKMRPAREVMPEVVAAHERLRGGPRKSSRKISVTLRLDPEVATALRALGPGWQTRTSAYLTNWARKSATRRAQARR